MNRYCNKPERTELRLSTIATSLLCSAGLAAILLGCPPTLAFADDENNATDSASSEEKGEEHGLLGGGVVGGGGGTIGGGSDIMPDEGDEVVPTEPFGTILKITDDGRLFAALYLPGLPALWENESDPKLETLYVERAYADAPDAFSPLYTFVWYPDWNMYAAEEDNSRGIHPFGAVPCATYLDYATNYQSFYLRARAVCTVDGATTEINYQPVLFTVPEGTKPGDEVVDKPVDDAGGSGGNQGGIGQGETERPSIDPPSFEPESPDNATPPSDAEAAPKEESDSSSMLGIPLSLPKAYGTTPDQTTERTASAGTADTAASASGDQDTPTSSANPAETAQTSSNAAAKSNAGDAVSSSSTQKETPSNEEESRIPGSILAVAATAILGGATALALRLRRSNA